MAWNRDSLQTIIDRIEGDLVSGLSIVSPVLRRALARILSRVEGGSSHMMHGHIEYMIKQQRAKTADRENLLLMAAEDSVYPTAAEFSSGLVVVTGTNGEAIPLETILRRADGREYIVKTLNGITAGEARPTVESVLAGAEGDLAAGEVLTLGAPIPGIDSAVTVDTGGIGGGADEEEIEAFRARYLEDLQNEDLGGSDSDWIKWAKEVPGVTRAWVYRHEGGLGTVTVRFVRDKDVSIFPDVGEVAAVQAKFISERPTTSEPTAAGPSDLTIAFTIGITPNNANQRAAVTAELKDLLFRKGIPGNGSGLGTILLAELRTAVGNVSPNYTMTVPSANIVPALGQLPTVGVITWI